MTTSPDTHMPPAGGSAPRGTERPEVACARQVDGLFTYCLSVLCDHDAALAAVRSVREMAVRHHDRLRDPALLRAWLYSLARYACLLRLEDAEPDGGSAGPPPTAAQERERRDRLAVLAWPEAAGTTAQQREALELAVRHGLAPAEVAAVLGLEPEAASVLLAQAACEVERTRTALRVLAAADCPELERLGGGRPAPDRGGLPGPALRREVVQHLDGCPTCRATAERAVAGDPWPGAAVLRAGGPAGRALPLLAAPAGALAESPAGAGRRARRGRYGRGAGRAADPARGLTAARLRGWLGRPAEPGRGGGAGAGGTGGSGGSGAGAGAGAGDSGGEGEGGPGSGGSEGAGGDGPGAAGAPEGRRWGAVAADPRFDRQGFPRHRADPTDLGVVLRNRAVTTTVLAAVLVAPMAALWLVHRGGDGAAGPATVSAVRVDTPEAAYGYATAEGASRGAGPGGRGAGRLLGSAEHAGRHPQAGLGETLPPAAEPLSAAALPITVVGPAAGPGATGTAAPGPLAAGSVLSGSVLSGSVLPGAMLSAAVPPGPEQAGPEQAGPVQSGAEQSGAEQAGPPGSGIAAKQAAPAGRLAVEAREYGSRTVVTLTNPGVSTIVWRAVSDTAWLQLSRDSGALEAGQRITVIVTVDTDRVPHGHWAAHIALQPSDAVVTLEGSGRRSGEEGSHGPSPSPSSSPSPSPSPSGPPPSGPPPSQGPSPSPSAQPSGTPSEPPPAPGGPSGQPTPAQTPESPPPARQPADSPSAAPPTPSP
ncbi:hypothetical protein ACIQGZ_03470 [Streptomyces sp. NPDC092296]|uniref:BACON domain-containing protein n=1 Tax=Streptomyces sp. NPDC092296 TaxID=3366012 RepID=UPI00380C801C